jgi:hypothetical protein
MARQESLLSAQGSMMARPPDKSGCRQTIEKSLAEDAVAIV